MMMTQALRRKDNLMHIYSGKTNFTLLQLGPDKKPARFKGQIEWLKDKYYGELSAKTPWGENYSGLIDRGGGRQAINKGFIRGDQGSAYEMRIIRSSGGEMGNITLRSQEKSICLGQGVLTGDIFYNDEEQIKKEKKLEEEIIARGQTETKK